MAFSVKLLNSKKASKAFQLMARKFGDLRPAWQDVRDKFFDIETKRFASQGGGGKWRPLNPKYAAWKQKHFPGTTIMIRTGDLAASLTSMTKDTIYIPGRRSVTLGTKLFYAMIHQVGAKLRGAGQSRLPKRKLIRITKANEKTFALSMTKYIKTVAKKAGFKHGVR